MTTDEAHPALEPPVEETVVEAPAWPAEPYKGLATYSARDRLLFSGRQDDVQRCMTRLTSNSTRILMIHGHTGCGKSSFLRAGLIPRMEETGAGHLFLRDGDGQPLFIRCGADPLSRLAERIYAFASKPIEQQDVDGSYLIETDGAWRLGATDVARYVECCRESGAFCESLGKLMVTEGLFSTLYVILDQVEEVITLAKTGSNADIEFFRFVREFGTFRFPLKMVFALRKDYSGQVIEMAQFAGGIDLAGPSAASDDAGSIGRGAGAARRVVEGRSDIKLYLLREFDKAKVESAIVLPTLDKVNGRKVDMPPSKFYNFRYEDGLPRRVTDDLFKLSSTAVLPAMQIVCRDLFEVSISRAKAQAIPGAAVPVALIDKTLYGKRGEIEGPVDRHISTSLCACFDPGLMDEVRVDEELRWRLVLLTLVNRESDGSAHTKQVSIEAFKDEVKKQGCLTPIEPAIAHLEKPEVLLLRRVQSEYSAEPAINLCLGHDFLAMVLDRWNTRREADARARLEAERAAAEAIAKAQALAAKREAQRNRRVRFIAVSAAVAVLSTIALAAVIVVSLTVGRVTNSIQVMSDAALALRNDQPALASLIAARAVQEADSLPKVLFPTIRSETAVGLRSILARWPEWQSRSATGLAVSKGTSEGMPLPLSQAFLSLRDDGGSITTFQGATLAFALEPLKTAADETSSFGQRIDNSISEVKPGVVAILRARVAGSETQDFQVDLLDVRSGVASGRVLRYGARTFDGAWSEDADKPNLSRSVVLGRGVVFVNVVSLDASLAGGLRLETTVYPLEPLLGSAPATSGTRLQPFVIPVSGSEGGTNFQFAWLDDGIALRQQVGSNIEATFVNWQGKLMPLFRGASAGDTSVESYVPPCPRDCVWTLAGVTTDKVALVFGTQSLSDSPSLVQASESRARIANFDSLLLTDAARGVSVTLDTKKLPDCDAPGNRGSSRRAKALLGASESPVTDFVALDRRQGFIIGVARGARGMDILRVDDRGQPACVKSISFDGALDHWAISADGSTLMASGSKLHARWKLNAAPPTLSTDESKPLLAEACRAGLKDTMARDEPLFKPATHLDSSGLPLCTD